MNHSECVFFLFFCFFALRRNKFFFIEGEACNEFQVEETRNRYMPFTLCFTLCEGDVRRPQCKNCCALYRLSPHRESRKVFLWYRTFLFLSRITDKIYLFFSKIKYFLMSTRPKLSCRCGVRNNKKEWVYLSNKFADLFHPSFCKRNIRFKYDYFFKCADHLNFCFKNGLNIS